MEVESSPFPTAITSTRDHAAGSSPSSMHGPSETSEVTWGTDPLLARVDAMRVESLAERSQRIVVVAPHPDAEILACGGLLSMLAQGGNPILVIAVTDGETAHAPRVGHAQDRIARARMLERIEGLRCIGIEEPQLSIVRLQIADGTVDRAGEWLTLELRFYLRAEDLVITSWQRDGHPDHEATAAAVLRVARTTGCRILQAPLLMWNWATPGDSRIPWEQMRKIILPTATVEQKVRALRVHRTQVMPLGGEPAILDHGAIERAGRNAEFYFV